MKKTLIISLFFLGVVCILASFVSASVAVGERDPAQLSAQYFFANLLFMGGVIMSLAAAVMGYFGFQGSRENHHQ